MHQELCDPDLEELARAVEERCTVSGDFVLKSGDASTEYFDKYAFESDPVLLRRVADRMAALVPAGTELLGGLELGGIPLATVLSSLTGLPVVFVRKQARTYGTRRIVEGCDVFGRKVLLVDDVITSGGAVRDAAVALRAEGATVDTVVCAVDRNAVGNTVLSAIGIHLMPVMTKSMLEAAAGRSRQATSTGNTAGP